MNIRNLRRNRTWVWSLRTRSRPNFSRISLAQAMNYSSTSPAHGTTVHTSCQCSWWESNPWSVIVVNKKFISIFTRSGSVCIVVYPCYLESHLMTGVNLASMHVFMTVWGRTTTVAAPRWFILTSSFLHQRTSWGYRGIIAANIARVTYMQNRFTCCNYIQGRQNCLIRR